jgi:hypothetical protein
VTSGVEENLSPIRNSETPMLICRISKQMHMWHYRERYSSGLEIQIISDTMKVSNKMFIFHECNGNNRTFVLNGKPAHIRVKFQIKEYSLQ